MIKVLIDVSIHTPSLEKLRALKDVSVAATWKGIGDVRMLAGRAVRINFIMRNAKLFAFEFAD